MLKPAQLYENTLRAKILDEWYRPENVYWNGGTFDSLADLPVNNAEAHHFVSLNKRDEVIGYIAYEVDWAAMSADGLCIISFDKGNPTFGRDVYQAVCNIFQTYHLNRLQFFCYADNPAIRSYRRFVICHGGREAGYYRQATKLQDGKLHDDVTFEILASEFKPLSKRVSE